MADPNRALLEAVVTLLSPLLDELVFVGGCTTGLFITDIGANPIRVTRDVDVIADVTTYAQYASLAERLRRLGFVEDDSLGAPLCRWRHGIAIIDVMPTDAAILGFSNRWYPVAIATAQRIQVARHIAQVVTPALFVATKLEAFRGRGGGDVFMSQDLEDIVAVVDGRPEIVDDVAKAAPDVRAYIAAEIQKLLHERDLVEAIPGFLQPDRASQLRRELIEKRLRSMST